MSSNALKECKKVSRRIALQLYYNEEVLNKIEKADSVEEVYRIMCTARKEMNNG